MTGKTALKLKCETECNTMTWTKKGAALRQTFKFKMNTFVNNVNAQQFIEPVSAELHSRIIMLSVFSGAKPLAHGPKKD